MSDKYADLHLVPLTLKQANQYVADKHRHHKPTVGHKFSVGVADNEKLVGVAIAGRPVARHLDNGERLEVLRVCTDGTKNACSVLYGAMRRAGMALGYKPEDILTYILDTEDGTSLRAAGWVKVADSRGGSWNCESRPRKDKAPLNPKTRWHAAMPKETDDED